MRVWLKYAWSAMRPAIVEGLICYGPPRGAQATFVRVDQWLPSQKAADPDDGRVELAKRFLTGVRSGDASGLFEVGGAEHQRDENRLRPSCGTR